MTEKTATPKKTAAKTKKPRTAPSHPKVADMVDAAIKTLKDRSGSSLQAIKKYIATTYKVDADKLAPFIRKYLKSGVASGGLVQTKGKGASGSFRIGGSGGAAKSASKAKKSAAKPKTAKASTPKKVAKPKKSPQKSKPKKASPAKKSKPVAKAAAKKVKSAKTAAKKKPAKSSPKKKAAPKKAKK